MVMIIFKCSISSHIWNFFFLKQIKNKKKYKAYLNIEPLMICLIPYIFVFFFVSGMLVPWISPKTSVLFFFWQFKPGFKQKILVRLSIYASANAKIICCRFLNPLSWGLAFCVVGLVNGIIFFFFLCQVTTNKKSMKCF